MRACVGGGRGPLCAGWADTSGAPRSAWRHAWQTLNGIVLHIATVHFGSPDWIEIQTRYLRRHIAVPYQTWASVESIDASYGSYFDHIIDQAGRHSGKLNHLATEILVEAREDDLLMFLDGDAFPITDPMPLIADGLARGKLVAVRRSENLGDRQPHPCFCVTTAGTWRQLCGDWSAGYR